MPTCSVFNCSNRTKSNKYKEEKLKSFISTGKLISNNHLSYFAKDHL